MSSLREKISLKLEDKGETWADVEACEFNEEQLSRHLSEHFGGGNFDSQEHELFVWSKKSVMSLGEYDGTEWLEAWPRNPPEKKP